MPCWKLKVDPTVFGLIFSLGDKLKTYRLMNILELKNNPTFRDFQEYVKELEAVRGFEDQNSLEKCLLLGEELGELFKAVRKSMNLKTDINSNIGSVREEIADMVIYLCAIANRFEIDIEEAFREKEVINQRREWK